MSHLVISLDTIKSRTNVQQLVSNPAVETSINPIFAKYFETILGDFYTNISDKLNATPTPVFTAEEQTIINRLTDALSFYVVGENFKLLSIKITKSGTQRVSPIDNSPIEIDDLDSLKQEYLNMANLMRDSFLSWFNSTYPDKSVSREMRKTNSAFVMRRGKDLNTTVGLGYGGGGGGGVGPKGDPGVGIASITQPSGSFNALVTYTDGDTDILLLPSGSAGTNGTNGNDGRGIVSITQPSGSFNALVTYTTGSTDTLLLPSGSVGPQGPSGSAGISPYSDRYLTYNQYFWDTHFTNGNSAAVNNSTGEGFFITGTSVLFGVDQSLVTNPRGPGHARLGVTSPADIAKAVRGGRGGAQYAHLSLANGSIELGMVVNFPVITDGTQTYNWRFGLTTSALANLNNAAFVEMSLASGVARWRLITRNAGVTMESINTSLTVVGGTSYLVELHLTPGSAHAFINRASIASNNTNLPTGNFFTFFELNKTAGSTARQADHDWYYEYQLLNNPF